MYVIFNFEVVVKLWTPVMVLIHTTLHYVIITSCVLPRPYAHTRTVPTTHRTIYYPTHLSASVHIVNPVPNLQIADSAVLASLDVVHLFNRWPVRLPRVLLPLEPIVLTQPG